MREDESASNAKGPGRQLVIFGAGGHGRVCADIAVAAGMQILGFCDSGKAKGTRINGYDVIAQSLAALGDAAPADSTAVFIAVGENEKRQALFSGALALGYEVATLIHPSVIIAPSAKIGAGTVVMPGVIVNANSAIGQACIINTGATLDHDNHLADGVQISPGVHSAGNVSFGRNAFVGTGAAIIPGIKIGANALVGAGAVVIRDVAADSCVVGNPARLI